MAVTNANASQDMSSSKVSQTEEEYVWISMSAGSNNTTVILTPLVRTMMVVTIVHVMTVLLEMEEFAQVYTIKYIDIDFEIFFQISTNAKASITIVMITQIAAIPLEAMIAHVNKDTKAMEQTVQVSYVMAILL